MGLTINRLLQDLHAATGLAVHLYDAQGRMLFHTAGAQPFCSLLHTAPGTRERCLAFDHELFREAERHGDVLARECPFGIFAAICPIFDTDKLNGFLMMSNVMDEAPEHVESVRARALSVLPQDAARIHDRLTSFPKLPRATLNAVPSILRTVCAYIEMQSLFPAGDITLGLLIKRYIKHNLQGKLTLSDIGANLHCSKATLTETFRREFGITIVQYINTLRLQKAEHLLCNTEMPVRTVAEECGFSGAEYFSSLFKKECGCSPLAYRHAHAAKKEVAYAE